jgi:hypothetical protein
MGNSKTWYSSPDFARAIKSRGDEMGGLSREMNNAHSILAGNLKEKNYLRDLGKNQRIILKRTLKK